VEMRLRPRGAVFLYFCSAHTEKTPQKPKNSEIYSIIFVDISVFWRIIYFRMDMHNDVSMAQCGDLAEITGKKLVVGAKQLRKALASGGANKVYLAQNADPAITEPIEAMCREKGVPFLWVRTMAELGKACGIQVGAAAAATVD